MARSFAAGDYTLIMAVESAKTSEQYYRVCQANADGNLSCDCPAWIFSRAVPKSCKHTTVAARLIHAPPPQGAAPRRAAVALSAIDPIVSAAQRQWPGLQGTWGFQQQSGQIGTAAYRFFLLTLTTPNGDFASGAVALADAHHLRYDDAVVALWAGYAIAATIARGNGYALQGTPPEHFVLSERAATDTPRPRAARGIGMADLLRIGDNVDLGDGLLPRQRAENTLRLFLGPLYNDLERTGYLDVSSRLTPGRVYRLRRDPSHIRERRLRVFEGGSYQRDFCIIRASDVPEADFFLALFLGLITDEAKTISVVNPRLNIFPTNSDHMGPERETVPAVWRAATPLNA